ncbi:MAG TPA: phosphatase PAP2 family protein [Puia sp.]|nr:phosphatase PAP2 family protein [Puia sp.]
MPQTVLIEARQEWHAAWRIRDFRIKMIIGLILVIATLSSFPSFFQRIQRRNGAHLYDPILRWLPAHDVSIPLFIMIWTLSLLALFRAFQNPRILLIFCWSYFLLSALREVTIALVPLDPPANLIGLVDPLSNFFYGPKFVTKDLFPSGHTATVFLLFFCLPGKGDRRIALIITFGVAFLLLVQHVHYTLDVLGGFLYGWFAWWLVTRTVTRDYPA